MTRVRCEYYSEEPTKTNRIRDVLTLIGVAVVLSLIILGIRCLAVRSWRKHQCGDRVMIIGDASNRIYTVIDFNDDQSVPEDTFISGFVDGELRRLSVSQYVLKDTE